MLEIRSKTQVRGESRPTPVSGLVFALEDGEERCTVELRAPMGDRIRVMFSSKAVNELLFEEYSEEEMKYSFRSACLTIRDVEDSNVVSRQMSSLVFRAIELESMIVPVAR